jgi:hypothetical protein
MIALHLDGDNGFQHLLNALDWRNGQWYDAETSNEEITGDLNEDSKDVDGLEPACEVCETYQSYLEKKEGEYPTCSRCIARGDGEDKDSKKMLQARTFGDDLGSIG